MVMRRTVWRPDTCSCVLEYEWDDEVAEIDRVLTPVSVIPCSVHAGAADPYLAAVEDNKTKNRTVSQISDVAHEWSYDENRNLVVKVLEKDKVQTVRRKIKEENVKIVT